MAHSQLQKVVYQMVDAGELERLNIFLEETTVSCTKWFTFPTILHKDYEGEALIGEIWDRVLKRFSQEADSADGLSLRNRVYGFKIGRLLLHKSVQSDEENKQSCFFVSNDKVKSGNNFSNDDIFFFFKNSEQFHSLFKSQECRIKIVHSLQMKQLVKAWDEASPKDREIGNVRVLDPIPEEVIAQMNAPSRPFQMSYNPSMIVATAYGPMSQVNASSSLYMSDYISGRRH